MGWGIMQVRGMIWMGPNRLKDNFKRELVSDHSNERACRWCGGAH